MKAYKELLASKVRLIILVTLRGERTRSLTETMLQAQLDAEGYKRPLEYLRVQLRALEDMDAIKVTDAGCELIAQLLRLGRAHLDLRVELDGVANPADEI